MKRSYTTVFFDLDGTILDTCSSILGSLRITTRKVLGRVIPDEVLIAKVGQPLITQIESFTATPEERDAVLAAYRQHNEVNLNEKIQPFEGIGKTVDELRDAGFRTGVVTSKRRSIAESSLAYFGLRERFECLVGLEDTANHKPHPEPLFKAAELLRVPLVECVYVGDSPYDMQAAHAADIPCIGVTWGEFFSRPVLEAENPTILVDKPAEIPSALSRIVR